MADEEKITGIEKAAILMMNIGEDLAAEVFKHLTPAEMQLVAGTIVKKDYLSGRVGKQVVGEFLSSYSGGESLVEGLEYAKSVIIKALGHERGKFLVDHLTREMGSGGIESLKWLDPAAVANIIRHEHPQITALILAHLDPDKGAQVLLHIPEERVRADIMLRVASLKRIPQAAVKDLESLLSEQMLSGDSGQSSNVEGVKVAAEIMNYVDSKFENTIMDTIEKMSPDTAIKIQEKMFLFSDLLGIDNRGLQQIIRELSSDNIAMALKGTDEAMKAKFLSNVSERAAEQLMEDMENKGPVKIADVEKAQQEIIKVARRLEQEGKIVRAGKGGDVVI